MTQSPWRGKGFSTTDERGIDQGNSNIGGYICSTCQRRRTDTDYPGEEIATIWQLMGEGEVSMVITQEDYQYNWREVKGSTSSSLLGLHFGHYVYCCWRRNLQYHSLISATGSVPQRWARARGLSVRLEKIAGGDSRFISKSTSMSSRIQQLRINIST